MILINGFVLAANRHMVWSNFYGTSFGSCLVQGLAVNEVNGQAHIYRIIAQTYVVMMSVKKINSICSSKRTTGCEWLNVLRCLHQHTGEPQWRGFTQLSLYEMACCQHSYRPHDMHTPEEMCFVFCTITISMWVWLHCNALDDIPKRLMVSSEFHLPYDLCLHSSVLWFRSRKFQRLWSCGWKHRPFTSFMLKHVAKNQSIAVFQPTRGSHGEGSLLLHINNGGGLNWAPRKRTEHRAPSSRPELRKRCSSEPHHRLQGQTSCAEAAKGQGRSLSIYYWCPLAELSLVKVDIARTSLQPSYNTLHCECAARWADDSRLGVYLTVQLLQQQEHESH